MPIGDRDWYREDFERKHRRNDPPFKRVDHCWPKARQYFSVTEVDNGVIVKNTGSCPCRIGVTSPEGEQQFELNVGESVTVTGITEPIEVWASRGGMT